VKRRIPGLSSPFGLRIAREFFFSPDATHMSKSRYSFVTAEQP
jgi:hypothetical protein